MAGAFTTLSASSTVNFTSGAQTGYLWQCTNGATGLGSWVALSAISGAGGALTVSNDTNITATFTGSSSTALLTPVTINLAWAGTLAVGRGGTNFNGTGLTLGDILYASSSSAFSRLAGNTTGNTRKFLVSTASGGVATAPTWDYLTGADFANMVTSLTSLGFGMSAPTNSYISSTSRTSIAGANYQISLGGTYTAISTTTSIIDLDITTTHVSTTSALTTSAGLQITPNTNATSGGITNHYALLINAGTNAGGTITNAYGILAKTPSTSATNKAAIYTESLYCGASGGSPGSLANGTIVSTALTGSRLVQTDGSSALASVASGTDNTYGLRGDITWARGPIIYSDVTFGADTARQTLSSLPGGFSVIRAYIYVRSTNASNFIQFDISLNNTGSSPDSGANYDLQYSQAGATTFSAANLNGQTAFYAGTIAAASSAQTNSFGAIQVTIPAYSTSGNYKTLLSQGGYSNTTAGLMSNNVGQWRNTAAITVISFAARSGNMKAGSRIIVVLE